MARDSSELVSGNPPPPADVRIAYGPEPLQFGDLRLPDGPGPHPLLVVLHGGYWRASVNLIHLGHLCRALAAEGVATWNLEFRRTGDPGGGWPGTLEDVRLGLDFVGELARRYPIDGERVALLGHSAGGHLALGAADRIPLRGVLAVAPAVELEAIAARGGGGGAVELFLGDAPFADAAPGVVDVPVVVIHGTEDATVPFADGVAYAERSGARLVPLDGAGHFEPIDPLAAEWDVLRGEVLALLR